MIINSLMIESSFVFRDEDLFVYLFVYVSRRTEEHFTYPMETYFTQATNIIPRKAAEHKALVSDY